MRARLCAAWLAPWAAAAGASNREVEHVVCQVCRLAVEEAPALLEGGEAVDEESVEALCSARRAEGRWLTRLDLEQDAETIRVVRREEFGECRRECLTVQRACARAFEGREEAVAQLLLAGADAARLRSEVCSGPCAVVPRPLAQGRRDEVFRPAAAAAPRGAAAPAAEAAAPAQAGGGAQEAARRPRHGEDAAAEAAAEEPGEAAPAAAGEGRAGAAGAGGGGPANGSRRGGDEVLQVEETKRRIQERAGGAEPEEHGAVEEVQVVELGESQNASELIWNALRELLAAAAEENASAVAGAHVARRGDGGASEGEASAAQASEPPAAGRTAQGGLKVDRKVEIDHVKCPVCRLAVAEAAEVVEKGGLREDEDALADVVESLCSVNKRAGRWLTKLDLQQEGDRIQVVQHATYGECRRECLTVQRACTKGLQGQDASLVRLLAAGAGAAATDADEVCRRACRRPPEPVRGERLDEAFEPKGALESALIEAVDELSAQKQRAGDGPEATQAAASPAAAAAAPPPAAAAAGGGARGGPPHEAPGHPPQRVPAGRPAATGVDADAPAEEGAGLAGLLGPAAARLLALWLGARRGGGGGAPAAPAAPATLSQALAVAAAVLVWLLWLLWRSSAAAAVRGGPAAAAPRWRRGAGAGRAARSTLGDSGEDAAPSSVAELAEALRSQEDRLLEARRASSLAAAALSRAALAEAAEAAALAEGLREELARAAPAGARLRRRSRAGGARAPGRGAGGRADPGDDACAWCAAEEAAYLCRGCGLARYCGPACQRLDWRGAHRERCGRAGS